MDEFALIREYFAKAITNNTVALGIGDDCAVLVPPVGQHLAVSMDTLVQGTHFPEGAAAQHIASRALATALSDLAAMGATPLWCTLGLTLPAANRQWVSDFCASFLAFAADHQCVLVGGDMTRGPLTVTVQVHGSVAPNHALCRSSAQPGNLIYVTGSLGDGAAALALIQHRLAVNEKSAHDYLINRFYRPTPRIAEGLLLRGIAHAAIDVSDGLRADLAHICEASGLGAEIDVNRVPISGHWRNRVSREQALAWALAGGDDYELCFTVPPTQVKALEHLIGQGQPKATAIGKITRKPEISWVDEGKILTLDQRGYNHFD